jgi:hypothetical protein
MHDASIENREPSASDRSEIFSEMLLIVFTFQSHRNFDAYVTQCSRVANSASNASGTMASDCAAKA